MAVAASLNVLLTAQTAAFQAGMKKAETTTKQFQSVIGRAQSTLATFRAVVSGVAGAAGIRAIASSFVGAVRAFDDMADVAERLNLSFQEFGAVRDAMTNASIDFESVSDAIEKMNVNIGKASEGSKSMQAALGSIGLSASALEGRSASESFFSIIDRLRGIEDVSRRAALQQEIFGRASKEVGNILSLSAEQYSTLKSRSADLSQQLSNGQVKALSDVDKALNRAANSWDKFWQSAASKAAPGVTSVLDSVTDTLNNGSLLTVREAPDLRKMFEAKGFKFGPQPSADQRRATDPGFARGEATVLGFFDKLKTAGDQFLRVSDKLKENQKVADQQARVAKVAAEQRSEGIRAGVNGFATLAVTLMSAADKLKLDAARIAPAASTLTAGSNASRLFDFNRQQADRAEKLLKKPAEQQVQLLQKVLDVMRRVQENTREEKVFDIF